MPNFEKDYLPSCFGWLLQVDRPFRSMPDTIDPQSPQQGGSKPTPNVTAVYFGSAVVLDAAIITGFSTILSPLVAANPAAVVLLFLLLTALVVIGSILGLRHLPSAF